MAPPKADADVTIEELGAQLMEDKQANEPVLAVGGAELAGAQIAGDELPPMTAREPKDIV